uniref:Ovule protein n=1 Tax=Haemonchus placei TaxID=6290 RepID=A0A158QL64_HAEPC
LSNFTAPQYISALYRPDMTLAKALHSLILVPRSNLSSYSSRNRENSQPGLLSYMTYPLSARRIPCTVRIGRCSSRATKLTLSSLKVESAFADHGTFVTDVIGACETFGLTSYICSLHSAGLILRLPFSSTFV